MYFLSQSEVLELETYHKVPKMRGVENIFRSYKTPLQFILFAMMPHFPIQF